MAYHFTSRRNELLDKVVLDRSSIYKKPDLNISDFLSKITEVLHIGGHPPRRLKRPQFTRMTNISVSILSLGRGQSPNEARFTIPKVKVIL